MPRPERAATSAGEGLVRALARAQSHFARALTAGARRGPTAPLPPLATLRRIVVVRPDELGDLVLTTPLLRELRRAAPDAHIALVVQPATADVVRASPHVDEVLVYDPRCDRRLRPFTLPLRALRFGRERLAPLRPELVLLPRWDGDQVYATFAAAASGARWRVGYSETANAYKGRLNAGYDRLLTHALPTSGPAHEVERALDLLRALGAEPADDRLELSWTEDDDARAAALLGESMGPHGPVVALCPSYGHSALKRWPPERFAELARRLVARRDARVVIVGAAADRDLARPIRDALGDDALDLTGRTTLPQLAALLRRCAAFVGADTGVLHMACAVGTPAVGVYGPTNVVRFRPWGGELVTRDLPCSPAHRAPGLDRCGVCVQGEPVCLLELPVEMVEAAVVPLLDRSPAAR